MLRKFPNHSLSFSQDFVVIIWCAFDCASNHSVSVVLRNNLWLLVLNYLWDHLGELPEEGKMYGLFIQVSAMAYTVEVRVAVPEGYSVNSW